MRQSVLTAKWGTILLLVLILTTPLSTAIQIAPGEVNVGERSAIVNWNTDVTSLGVIEYGTNALDLDQRDESRLTTAPARSHSAILNNLDPNTEYFYRITAIDAAQDIGESTQTETVMSFITRASSDNFPPAINNIRIVEKTANTATIGFTTSETARGKIRFGEDGTTLNEQEFPLEREHAVTIGAASDKVIDTIIDACDADGNCAQKTFSFLAGDPQGPPVLGVTVPNIVRSNVVTVTGITRPFATIEVSVAGETQRTGKADREGQFALQGIILFENEETITVKARDENGNQAEQSVTVTIDSKPPSLQITKPNAVSKTTNIRFTGTVSEAVLLRVTEKEQQKELKVQNVGPGEFETEFSVEDGIHTIEVSAEDDAGHKVSTTFDLTVDKLPPQILNHNLDTISPTYIPDITIEGQVSEFSTVFVFIDNDGVATRNVNAPLEIGSAVGTTVTDSDGRFKIQVRLPPEGGAEVDIGSFDIQGGVQTNTNRGLNTASVSAGLSPQDGVRHRVQIVAVDAAGHASNTAQNNVIFTACSEAGPFAVSIEHLTPEVLTPQLIANGRQQIGMGIKLDYRGLDEIRDIRVNPRLFTPNPREEEKFDNDFIRSITSFFPRHAQSKEGATGFVNFIFANQVGNDDANNLDKIEEISEHRRNECFPGANTGCVKLMMILDITAKERIDQTFIDPRTDPTSETFQLREIEQRTCVPIQMQIDRSVQVGKHIPVSLLEASAQFADSAIETIEFITKPLATVATFMTYGCIVSSGWYYLRQIFEKLECDFAAGPVRAFASFAGGPNDIKDAAEAGICQQKFGSDTSKDATGYTSEEKLKACEKCAKEKEETIKAWQVLKRLCDRVTCPAAPTFQTYIKDQQESHGSGVRLNAQNTGVQLIMSEADARAAPGATDAAAKPGSINILDYIVTDAGKIGIFAGNDCAFSTETIQTGYYGIKELYDKTQDRAYIEKLCSPALRPAHPDCCGYTYTQEWGSACGDELVGNAAEFFDFDELKESVCLAAQKVGQRAVPGREIDDGRTLSEEEREALTAGELLPEPADPEGSFATVPVTEARIEGLDAVESSKTIDTANNIDCGGVVNSIAGFCQPNGLPSVDMKYTGVTLNSVIQPAQVATLGAEGAENPLYAASDDKKLYIFIVPYAGEAGGTEEYLYDVFIGYAGKQTVLINRDPKIRSTNPNERGDFLIPLGTVMGASKLESVNNLFTVEQLNAYAENRGVAQDLQKKLAERIAIHAGQPAASVKKNLWEEIANSIGSVDQEYIVRPGEEGIIRATQCMCLPSLLAHLENWKARLQWAKSCFASLYINGEGTSQNCQEKAAVEICDTIYDAATCYAQKFNTPGVGKRIEEEFGFGNVLGAVTSAGTDVQRSMRSRYGDSTVWQSLYGEQQIVHSMCTYAFTGSWDLDIDGIIKKAADDIPIETQAEIITADRQFITFNPVTQPPGLTTWSYKIGLLIFPGRDIRYHVKLQCSADFSCNPAEGFIDGKCDCVDRPGGAKIIEVRDAQLGDGTLDKNEPLDRVADIVVQTDHVRYDKVFVTWEFRDQKTRQLRNESSSLLGDTLVQKQIRQRGPPPDSNFCQLDTFSGIFRCDIGIGDYSGARFRGTPEVIFPGTQTVYKLGDEVAFKVPVAVQTTKEPLAGCPASEQTKFLVWEIRKQDGTLIETNRPSSLTPNTLAPVTGTKGDEIAINIAGNSEVNVPKSNKKIVVDSALFNQRAGTSNTIPVTPLMKGKTVRVTNYEPTLPQDPINAVIVIDWTKTTNPVGGFYEGTGNNVRVNGNIQAPITLSEARRLLESSEPTDSANKKLVQEGKWGFYFKKLPFDTLRSLDGISGAQVTVTGRVITFRNGIDVYRVELDRPFEKGDYLELRYLQSGRSSFADYCSDERVAQVPQTFTANFELIDTEKNELRHCFDPNYDRTTIDPTTGEEARISVQFKAVCSKNIIADVTAEHTTGTLCTAAEMNHPLARSCYCGTLTELGNKIKEVGNDVPANVHNCGPGLADKNPFKNNAFICSREGIETPRCVDIEPSTDTARVIVDKDAREADKMIIRVDSKPEKIIGVFILGEKDKVSSIFSESQAKYYAAPGDVFIKDYKQTTGDRLFVGTKFTLKEKNGNIRKVLSGPAPVTVPGPIGTSIDAVRTAISVVESEGTPVVIEGFSLLKRFGESLVSFAQRNNVNPEEIEDFDYTEELPTLDDSQSNGPSPPELAPATVAEALPSPKVQAKTRAQEIVNKLRNGNTEKDYVSKTITVNSVTGTVSIEKRTGKSFPEEFDITITLEDIFIVDRRANGLISGEQETFSSAFSNINMYDATPEQLNELNRKYVELLNKINEQLP